MSKTPPSSPEQARPSVFPRMEEEIAAYWKQEKIFERSVAERPADKGYTFYDGPPFATGLPHYGHLVQSAMKDAVPRYWTMQWYRVPRKWGWDCHGLPIENIIEKELKLGSKKEIEAYGIDKFNTACSTAVFTYEKEWGRYVERIGRWVEFENSYKTMDNDYMESVWWVFSELHKKNYIYKGFRVSLYCPRCATPLSNFEIAMGNSYVDREDFTVYVKFPVQGEANTYFLAWTTTPWTLPANTGLSVHPTLTYVGMHFTETNETLIVAETRKDAVADGRSYEIVGTWTGSELVGKRYEPLYSFIPVEGDGYRVVAGEHVTAEDGTGIVHTAPAFGEEDLQMSQQHGLPILQTVDDEGLMIPECGPFAGKKMKDADPLVVEDLRVRGRLWRDEKITHSVPVCWRCDTLLFYKSQPAWFVDVTKLKPLMLKTAEKVHWHPAHFKEGRFGRGLDTAPDWNISRTRYWGSPLPVWECTGCDKRTIVGSIEELKSLAKPDSWPEVLDLHRPTIDQVVLSCACGGEQKRIQEVFDCWFESGSMPVASIHYPFENKKWFETHFPADFIGEGQDQTRGWFYVLHVLASALFEKPAFKDVIVTGIVLAEDGKKMSKKLKNYPDPWEVLTQYGADTLRYYLLSSTLVEAESLNFSKRDLETITRGLMNLVWNVKTFYETYSAGQQIVLEKPRSAHVLDRWLFARFQQLLDTVTKSMDGYELVKATRPIRDFVEDLSTWWLRRSRDRFKSENEFDKMDALRTLREILEELAKLMAPFTPFIAEKMYLDIGGSKASVHLEKWSKVQERLIDEKLLTDMRWVRQVASKGQEARVEVKIPVRQALASITIFVKSADEATRLSKQADLLALVREELNVEDVMLAARPDQADEMHVELDTVITPELRRKGLRREFVRQVMAYRKQLGLTPSDVVAFAYHTTSDELKTLIEELGPAMAKDVRAEAFILQADLTEPTAMRVSVGDSEVLLGKV